MKKILKSVIAAILFMVVTGGVVLAAGTLNWPLKVGPMDVSEPIITTIALDSPLIPPPGAIFSPGDSFTLKFTIQNGSPKYDYWVSMPIVSWNGPIKLGITFAEGNTAITTVPLQIPAGTTKTITMTVTIQKDSPAASGINFTIEPPQRMLAPEKG